MAEARVSPWKWALSWIVYPVLAAYLYAVVGLAYVCYWVEQTWNE